MKSIRHVRVAPLEGPAEDSPASPASGFPTYHRLAGPLRRSILLTRQWLLAEQHADGHWEGELEGDTILESEYLLLLAYLGQHRSPLGMKCARYLLEQQRTDGGWAIYPGGPVEISASVKGYFALKLTGHDPSSEPMERARKAILRHGGADAVNSFTRFYLALLGQISYDQCPAVPPEFLLLPKWAPVNLYSISSWSRTILVPLSIMSAHRPVTQIDPRLGISELFLKPPHQWRPTRCPGLASGLGPRAWDRFFRFMDRTFKFAQHHRLTPLRKRALRTARDWMVERFDGSDGLGAIFPPMVWSIVALRCLGYRDDSPEMQYCQERLQGLVIEDEETARLQPCKSPVWDTAITVRALAESGLAADHPALGKAAQWLVGKEVRRRGDWSHNVQAEPGGWCFEHANDFYPDLDDTAMVSMALHAHFHGARRDKALPPGFRLVVDTTAATVPQARGKADLADRAAAAVERGSRWMEAMQNRDGGWGAFDKDNTAEFLCHVPFADHNAMIDPSSPDLTGRVLEALGDAGRRLGDPVIDRAVAYLRRTQEADGSWFGRWGVNYIYGTWEVILGLTAVGVPADDPAIVAGANWLLAYQQPCGGWGETPASYDDPTLRGQGNPTPSQTAWAVMGLTAAGLHKHPATARGIRFLLSRQKSDGSWDEPEYTGTGFPRVFYLKYHWYRIYFPLMALSRWATAVGAALDEADETARSLAEVAFPRR
ncbi:MAG: terpene cyclase/mutase family protein [Pirellulales bacterium]